MGLSSNSLIHLTRRKEALFGILNNDFKIKFCRENVRTSAGDFNAAVPMVSFCDIPLSEIKNHINKYGHYGIGLTKEWGKTNGLNPVLYIDSKSMIGGDLRRSLKHILNGKSVGGPFTENQYMILNLFRYSKNYEGKLEKNNKVMDNYRFSDEREWRYVPPLTLAPIPVSLLEHYDTKEKKTGVNAKIQDLRLKFNPDDITYIIIKDESEISDVISQLRSVKGKKYPQDDIERLYTRILTTKQIMTDF